MKKSSVLDNKLLEKLGILDWGYTEEPVPQSLIHFEKWTEASLNSPLNYLGDHRKHLRRDLRHVFPEFESALVFLFSYQETKKWMIEENKHSIAAYALGFEGEDYHRALKNRLTKISESLNIPNLKFFFSIDAQPILERDLALRAGLGWFGKNSMIINQKEGSYFIIGSLLLNQKLPIEKSIIDDDHCGQCRACVDACPTNAIDPDSRTLHASRCISTYTIEIFKDAPAPIGFDKSRGEIFGCDICQDVCPWNKKPLARVMGKINIRESLIFLHEWFFEWPKEKLSTFIAGHTNRGFKKKLHGTAFDRPGKDGWIKNLKSNSSQSGLSKKQKYEE
jgi:epoxyqueuosine reductase